jgi:serine/threonine protein kinase
MPRMPLANGQTFAGYRIVRLLGSGGMGEVYLAQHPRLPKKVALKVLAADVSANADYRARFAYEAELASELDHPNIVVVHDRDEEDGQLWISMQYVDGLDAARLLTDKFPSGMPADQAAKIVTAVASALDYAHDHGLLHRDVKPANIMITSDKQRILLADFGIARNLKGIGSLTATGFVVATVPYAAPEQLKGQEPLDGRADQYALAKTAYDLLTGSQLFPHSLAEKPIGHAAIDAILATALAEKPKDRFATCTEFAKALTLADRGAWAVSPSGTLHPKQNDGSGSRQASDRATRPMPPERQPTSTSDDSVFIPSEVEGVVEGFWSRRRAMVGAFAVLLGISATAYAVHGPWQQDLATSSNTSAPKSVTPSITFDSMRDFVTGYYSDLPARPTEAWKKVDTQWQNQTGYQDFLDFWATIDSVTVVSVSPRDATSVIARVRYVPRTGQPSTEDRWLKMTLVDDKMLLDGSGRIGAVNEPTTAPPTTSSVASSAIDALLPDATAVSRISGAGPLKVKSATDQLSDNSSLVTPSRCVGVIFGNENATYAGTGFTGVRDQILQAEASSYDSAAPTLVEQTVVAFATPDQAKAVLQTSQRQWQDCARGLVSYRVPNTNNEVGWSFNFGEVQLRDNLLTVSMAGINRESGNSACQQVLGVRANIVVGVRSCNDAPDIPISATVADPDLAGQSAAHLAKDILSRIQS